MVSWRGENYLEILTGFGFTKCIGTRTYNEGNLNKGQVTIAYEQNKSCKLVIFEEKI